MDFLIINIALQLMFAILTDIIVYNFFPVHLSTYAELFKELWTKTSCLFSDSETDLNSKKASNEQVRR